MAIEAAFDVPAERGTAPKIPAPRTGVSVGDQELEVGWFRAPADGGRCWWSAGTYAIHALTPGDVVPTVELLLAHQHPDGRGRVAALLATVVAQGRGFACASRLVDFEGRTHDVVVSGQPGPGVDGGPYPVHGSVVLLDAVFHELASRRADVQLERALETRSVIDQAKGVLALARGLDADEAFDALRLVSQQRNVRVRALADEVLRRARSAADDAPPRWLRELLGGSGAPSGADRS